MALSCRWSCRFSPTPGRAWTTEAPDRLETIRVAHARKLQELGRADRACGQNDFPPGSRLVADAVLAVAQACGAAAVEQNALDMRAGDEMQVRPLEDRLQERRRRAPAPAAALIDLEIAGAFVVALIEVVDLRNADFDPGLPHRVEDRPGDARPLDPPFAARTMQGGQAPVMILLPDEIGQHVVPAPSGKAELAPAVIIGRLPAHIDHGVDGGRAADHAAARIGDRAAAQIGFGRRLEHPVGARIADRVEIADRNMEPDPIVAAASLDEENAVLGVAAQPIGEHAASRAGADDDEVVSFRAHGATAQQATSRPCLRWSGGLSTRQRSKASGQRG